MNDSFPAPPPQQPPAKQQATPGQTLLGCLIIIAVIVVIGFAVWYVFLQSPGSPTTTSTRTAQPGAAATHAAVAAFADIVLTGAGDDIKQISIPETSAALAVATHSGSGNFIVHSLAADGSDNDLLVNTIGSYAGTVMFDTGAAEHSTAIQVESDGTWSITIRPPSKAKTWNPTQALSGQGDDVVQLSPTPTGLTPIALTHAGLENFIVYAYTASDSSLLVNEIGAYHGTVALPTGTLFVTVEADGPWTIARD